MSRQRERARERSEEEGGGLVESRCSFFDEECERSQRARRFFQAKRTQILKKLKKTWPRFFCVFLFPSQRPLRNARLHFLLCCSPGTASSANCALEGREQQSWFLFAPPERAITRSVARVDRISFVFCAVAAPRPSFFHGRSRGGASKYVRRCVRPSKRWSKETSPKLKTIIQRENLPRKPKSLTPSSTSTSTTTPNHQKQPPAAPAPLSTARAFSPGRRPPLSWPRRSRSAKKRGEVFLYTFSPGASRGFFFPLHSETPPTHSLSPLALLSPFRMKKLFQATSSSPRPLAGAGAPTGGAPSRRRPRTRPRSSARCPSCLLLLLPPTTLLPTPTTSPCPATRPWPCCARSRRRSTSTPRSSSGPTSRSWPRSGRSRGPQRKGA